MSASNERLLVVEGYDGSGKSTLIDAFRSRLGSTPVQLVGRKKEIELQGIAAILEREDVRPTGEAEMLLRIAVEIERTRIIHRTLETGTIVVADRGVTSMRAWFDYLAVDRRTFVPLLDELDDFYQGALTIVCSADFRTCWTRSTARGAQSRKDRLGPDVNRRYFEQYQNNVAALLASESDVVVIDTVAASVPEATDALLWAARNRGIIVP